MLWRIVVEFALYLWWRGDYLAVSSNFLSFKLFPKFFEFQGVAFDVEGVVNDEKIFLVVAACLVSPIEGTRHNEFTINDHKLVVHVVLRSVIGPNENAKVSQSLNVTSFGECALIISNNPDLHTIFMSSDYGVGEIVISHCEDAD